MPAQKAVVGVLSRLGDQLMAAHNQYKDVDAIYDTGGELPAGLDGIAKLLDCHIKLHEDGDNKGKPFFYVSATVVSPTSFKGINVLGRRTQPAVASPMLPLYDTPKASTKTKFSDHYNDMINILKVLVGHNWRSSGYFKGNTTQEVEANLLRCMEVLRKVQPTFSFRTWKGAKQEILQDESGKYRLFDVFENGGKKVNKKKAQFAWSSKEAAEKANPYAGREPRVNHLWGDLVSWTGGSQVVDAGVVDNTDGTGRNGDAPPEPEPTVHSMERTNGATFSEFSVEELAAAADAGDKHATALLEDQARAAGIGDNVLNDESLTWSDIAAIIAGNVPGDVATEEVEAVSEEEEVAAEEPETEEREESWAPAPGDEYDYCPLDPKTRQPGKVRVKVKVQSVDTDSLTVVAQRQDTRGILKNLAWERLLRG